MTPNRVTIAGSRGSCLDFSRLSQPAEAAAKQRNAKQVQAKSNAAQRDAFPLRETASNGDTQHARPDASSLAEMPVDGFETWYAIGPYGEPSLPPDLAARFGLMLMQAVSKAALAVIGWPARWAEALQRARERRQQRGIFDKLDDHMLQDIGLTRCDLYDDLAHRRGRR